ncbi:MAG: alanine racemase [Sandaracinaceae bacterium]
MRWRAWSRALSGERLPAALVDLDALDRNVDRVRAHVAPFGKTLRVASKSVRHVGLLRRILERGGPCFSGLMCFSAEEAVFLRDRGFDDLLVAYPTVSPSGLRAVAEKVAAGATIRLMVDDRAHLDAAARAARGAKTELEVLLDVDVSMRPFRALHLGAQRSPLREVASIERLTRAAVQQEGVKPVGLMAYEAHVAGLPDASPFDRGLNHARRWFKRAAVPAVAEQRAAAIGAMRAAGVEPRIVNGGGTGSLRSTPREAGITEATAGSGFLCPHLFDYFQGSELEPASFFALEVCRIPEPGIVTCLGGGYIASGEPGWDRLPLPCAPPGLSYLTGEGAGEVQTPLRLGPSSPPLRVGDPVLFRHTKAGELAERFAHYLLLRDGAIESREPTYRGEGACFF